MHTDESNQARQLLVLFFAFPAGFEPLIKQQLEPGRPLLVSQLPRTIKSRTKKGIRG
jgi:hypothetical protein